MRWPAFALLVSVLMAGPALAQKISFDYDEDYDGESVKTFAWAETSDTSVKKSDPFLHSRIVNGIEYYLTQTGLREVESDPDVYVTYHTSKKEEVKVNTGSWGYGYPVTWTQPGVNERFGGWGSHSGNAMDSFEKGTLIVDLWDAGTEKLVWRGRAAGITIVLDPQKMSKKIDKALKKIVGEWRKLEKKTGN